MSKKLAIIAVSGLAICATCLVAAAAVGGKDFLHDVSFPGFQPRCGAASGEIASRSMDWNGDDGEVHIAMPANVHFRQGSGDKLVVEGDRAALAHVQVDDGKLSLDCRRRSGSGRFEVTLPGRAFHQFDLAGSGRLNLSDIDVPDLSIHVAGSGEVEASGKANNLEMVIAGSGDARLGELAIKSAELSVLGSGKAEIAPSERLEVNIAGSGQVRLKTEPRHLETHIARSGELIRAP